MKNLTWQNPEQLFVAQELINKVKSKCCGIKDVIKLRCKFLFSFVVVYLQWGGVYNNLLSDYGAKVLLIFHMCK